MQPVEADVAALPGRNGPLEQAGKQALPRTLLVRRQRGGVGALLKGQHEALVEAQRPAAAAQSSSAGRAQT